MYDLNEVGFSCILVLLHTQCIILYPKSFQLSQPYKLKQTRSIGLSVNCMVLGKQMATVDELLENVQQTHVWGYLGAIISFPFLSHWLCVWVCFSYGIKTFIFCSGGFYFLLLSLFQLFREITRLYLKSSFPYYRSFSFS